MHVSWQVMGVGTSILTCEIHVQRHGVHPHIGVCERSKVDRSSLKIFTDFRASLVLQFGLQTFKKITGSVFQFRFSSEKKSLGPWSTWAKSGFSRGHIGRPAAKKNTLGDRWHAENFQFFVRGMLEGFRIRWRENLNLNEYKLLALFYST